MRKSYILALDPGNRETGFCLLAPDLSPIKFGKLKNEEVKQECLDICSSTTFRPLEIAIEKIASYGMAVGADVLDTCIWIGRFYEALESYAPITYIYRKDEKMNLCHSMKANDSTIRQALVDRFAYGESNYGKGTKKEPGFFFGFKADIWAAFAVGVTLSDIQEELKNEYKQSNHNRPPY